MTTSSGTECNASIKTTDTANGKEEEQSATISDSMFDLRICDKYYVSERPSLYTRFRMFCKRFPESSKVSYFIMGVIVLNTFCMAVEHHNEVCLAGLNPISQATDLHGLHFG